MTNQTEKQKAQDLVDNFSGLVYPYSGSSMLSNDAYPEVILQNAKTCAFITVARIIEVVVDAWQRIPDIGPLDEYIPYQYWQKVQNEIEKITLK